MSAEDAFHVWGQLALWPKACLLFVVAVVASLGLTGVALIVCALLFAAAGAFAVVVDARVDAISMRTCRARRIIGVLALLAVAAALVDVHRIHVSMLNADGSGIPFAAYAAFWELWSRLSVIFGVAGLLTWGTVLLEGRARRRGRPV